MERVIRSGSWRLRVTDAVLSSGRDEYAPVIPTLGRPDPPSSASNYSECRWPPPAWFKEDLERLLSLLAGGAIRPRVAERLSFDRVAEAHRRLEVGGLKGKFVLCPETL